jgi:hypothetical protein
MDLVLFGLHLDLERLKVSSAEFVPRIMLDETVQLVFNGE